MDLVSVYTNIPNHEGILAIASWLLQDVSKKDIAQSILELLNLILHNTNFTINGELQVGGHSMETPCAHHLQTYFLTNLKQRP